MKRILLALLTVVVVLGLFAAVGYTGYRFGYAQGIQTTAGDEVARPGLRAFDEFSRHRMPMLDFGFQRGPGRGWDRFPMMGFGFFLPLLLLGRLAVLALIIGLIYWLFTRSGWRLTRQVAENPPPPRAEDE